MKTAKPLFMLCCSKVPVPFPDFPALPSWHWGNKSDSKTTINDLGWMAWTYVEALILRKKSNATGTLCIIPLLCVVPMIFAVYGYVNAYRWSSEAQATDVWAKWSTFSEVFVLIKKGYFILSKIPLNWTLRVHSVKGYCCSREWSRLNKRWAIIWNNDDPFNRRIYASVSFIDVLTFVPVIE